MPARTPRRSRTPAPILAAAVAAVTAAIVMSLLVGPLAGSAAGQPPAPDHQSPSAPTTGHPSGSPVVLIGVAGLSWSDVSEKTPALAELANSAIGSLVVRSVHSVTCPADGWLSLNTGTRAADAAGPCRVLEEPVTGNVPGWQEYLAQMQSQRYDARPGLLADVLADGQVSTAAIGPGAAIALADADGEVADYLPRAQPEELAGQVEQALGSADLLVIDAGTITEPESVAVEDDEDTARPELIARSLQVQQVDQRLTAILAGLRTAAPAGDLPTVLLAGVSDSGSSGLRAVALTGADAPAGFLSSSSTRQPGYVMGTDLFTTVVQQFELAGDVPDETTMGAPIRVIPGPADDGDARLTEMIDADAHAQAVKPIVPVYFLLLVLMNLALFATVTLVLKRSTASRIGAALTRRFDRQRLAEWLQHRLNRPVPALRSLRIVALGIGAVPIASFLANLLPWWRAHPSVLALAGLILLIDAAIVLSAVVGPWRRHPFGPAALVAGITALVLAIDVVTGATLQVSAVMGISALVGARFYGMNNTTFALFTVAMLMVAMVAANPLVLSGRRRLAALVVLGCGLFTATLDGAPAFGADFGGPPAILAGFGVMALLTLGVRLTWRKLLAVVVVAGLASVALAFVDWLRPPEDRTHLGRFFQTVLDGGLWEVVWRKLDQNISIVFGNRPLTILALCGVLTVVYVLARPIRTALTSPRGGEFAWLSAGNPISAMGEGAPMLKPGLIAMAVALGVGLAINDSGIAIPAIGVSLGVPLLIAATTTWMLSLRELPSGAVQS